MANYCCMIRTNYFHVKDDAAFRSLMNRVYGPDSVELWEKTDTAGKTVFGFGVYGDIFGLRDSDDEIDDDSTYDAFINALQASVADDDAIIILEVGSEKMRYLIGAAEIITSSDYKCIDITSLAQEEAARMLNNPSWQTQCDY